MDLLLAFRELTKADSSEYEFLDGAGGSPTDLAHAKVLRLKQTGAELDLSAKTRFESQDSALGFIDLRTVVNCWLNKNASVADYLQRSTSLNIPNLKFLERTDLIEWLEGSSDESEYIKFDSASGNVGASANEDVDMPDQTGDTLDTSYEREPALDHNSILHGQKLVDFRNVGPLCHRLLVSEFRHAGSQSSHSSRAPSAMGASRDVLPPLKPSKGKDPIILLSPSPSSLINMANVQEFLEKGVFNPVLKSAGSSNLLRVSRSSQMIGSRIRFVVVDSIDQFKPEYWDRLVAVFVTGQAWQFRGYRWQDPNALFEHVLGFGLVYKNDPVPEPMKRWNVKIETLERNTRFRDREIVERIWERIESHMIKRGWPVNTSA